MPITTLFTKKTLFKIRWHLGACFCRFCIRTWHISSYFSIARSVQNENTLYVSYLPSDQIWCDNTKLFLYLLVSSGFGYCWKWENTDLNNIEEIEKKYSKISLKKFSLDLVWTFGMRNINFYSVACIDWIIDVEHSETKQWEHYTVNTAQQVYFVQYTYVGVHLVQTLIMLFAPV